LYPMIFGEVKIFANISEFDICEQKFHKLYYSPISLAEYSVPGM